MAIFRNNSKAGKTKSMLITTKYFHNTSSKMNNRGFQNYYTVESKQMETA